MQHFRQSFNIIYTNQKLKLELDKAKAESMREDNRKLTNSFFQLENEDLVIQKEKYNFYINFKNHLETIKDNYIEYECNWAVYYGLKIIVIYNSNTVDRNKCPIRLKYYPNHIPAFQIIEDSVDTGEVGLWVLDSIGVLVSSAEMDEKKTYDDKVYGGISLALTRFSKKIEMLMQRHKCTGIGINQIRENLGSMYGGITTPGGKAWRHCCSVRMQFARGKYIDEKGNELNKSAETPVGNIVLMTMTKNKNCPPSRRTGQYTLRYDDGIDYLADLVDVAIRFDIIQKSGAWFDIINPDTGEILEGKLHGQSNVLSFLVEHDAILTQIENIINEKMLKDF